MNRSITIQRVEPREARERVVDLLLEHRHWPGSTREDYLRLWDWRYGSLGEGTPLSWLALTPDGHVVGHVAIFPRRYRVGETELRCALPGDLLVHRDWRASGAGARLVLIPRQLAKEGRFDVVLVVGNALAHRLTTRLGFRDLTTFEPYADLRRSGPRLGTRFTAAEYFGPVVDVALALRRSLRQRAGRRRAGRLVVEPLDADEVRRLDRTHWHHAPERVVGGESEEYLARRFLGDPFARREMFGLGDPATSRVEGHVAIEYADHRAIVCDCRVNATRLDEATAIGLVGNHLPKDVRTYAVPALPGSRLAGELKAAGFVPRPAESTDRRLHISAFWDAAHPLAETLRRLDAWSLYLGAADA